jgi:hypothetical protein
MISRPTSITIVGRLLAILGALGAGVTGVTLILIPTILKNSVMLQQMLGQSPKFALANLVLSFIDACITLACGIGLLRRKNWARYVLLGWWLVGFVFDVIVSNIGAEPLWSVFLSLLIFLVIVYLLFRPIATRYFTEAPSHL